ncbi:hypothetical protein BJ912DRAFT_1097947 [Pholiota molesta]|nr:hypothetical protein BJ912DRAFT_1097947 [Pholiota molesta]
MCPSPPTREVGRLCDSTATTTAFRFSQPPPCARPPAPPCARPPAPPRPRPPFLLRVPLPSNEGCGPALDLEIAGSRTREVLTESLPCRPPFADERANAGPPPPYHRPQPLPYNRRVPLRPARTTLRTASGDDGRPAGTMEGQRGRWKAMGHGGQPGRANDSQRARRTASGHDELPGGMRSVQGGRTTASEPDEQPATSPTDGQRARTPASGNDERPASVTDGQRGRRTASEGARQPASPTDGQRARSPASGHDEQPASANGGQRVRTAASGHGGQPGRAAAPSARPAPAPSTAPYPSVPIPPPSTASSALNDITRSPTCDLQPLPPPPTAPANPVAQNPSGVYSTCAGGVLYVGLDGQMGGGDDAPRGSPTSWVFPSLSSPKIPRSSGVGLVRVGKGGEVRGAKGEGGGGLMLMLNKFVQQSRVNSSSASANAERLPLTVVDNDLEASRPHFKLLIPLNSGWNLAQSSSATFNSTFNFSPSPAPPLGRSRQPQHHTRTQPRHLRSTTTFSALGNEGYGSWMRHVLGTGAITRPPPYRPPCYKHGATCAPATPEPPCLNGDGHVSTHDGAQRYNKHGRNEDGTSASTTSTGTTSVSAGTDHASTTLSSASANVERGHEHCGHSMQKGTTDTARTAMPQGRRPRLHRAWAQRARHNQHDQREHERGHSGPDEQATPARERPVTALVTRADEPQRGHDERGHESCAASTTTKRPLWEGRGRLDELARRAWHDGHKRDETASAGTGMTSTCNTRTSCVNAGMGSAGASA